MPGKGKGKHKFDELKATGRLPSPTGVALKVLKLTQQEDTTVQEISKVLQADPALTGKVLKYANSASLGSKRPAVAIQDAVVRLGIRMVKQLVLSFSLVSNNSKGKCEAFDYQSFWSRSLATAAGARVLGSLKKAINSEEAFTAGLLSNIGMLALASVHPQMYSEVIKSCKENSEKDLISAEEEKFAIDHNNISAFLLEDWGLPGICVESVKHHEKPGETDFEKDSRGFYFTWILNLAKEFAGVVLIDHEAEEAMTSAIILAGKKLGLEKDALVELYEKIKNDWREWGTILGIETHELPSESELKEWSGQNNGSEKDAQGSVAETQENDNNDSLRILIVGDDPLQIEEYKKILSTGGDRIEIAHNGSDGLQQILKEKPQLILLDREMAGMNGIEFCKTLRQSEEAQEIYIIMYTGDGDGEEESVLEAFEAGVDDFVVKSSESKLMEGRIKAARRLIKLQDQNRLKTEKIEQYVLELSVVNRKLQKAMDTKKEFLAKMSHELRTPINGISGMIQLLRTTEVTLEQERFIKVAFKCCENLNFLIKDILDFSSLEAGELKLSEEKFDLRHEIKEVFDLTKKQALEKKIKLSCKVEQNLPFSLKGDSRRLKQILFNLINNALKFTENGEISISIKCEEITNSNAKLRFSVRDTGIGIPQNKIKDLFQSFSQIENDLSEQSHGIGLGLAISKELCQKMGGDIGVESKPGEGSLFWFTAVFKKQNRNVADLQN